jgi:ribosomal protein S27AE
VEKRSTERRKVNQATGDERRGKAKDRRSCPQCGSAVGSHSEPYPGGTLTRRYCTRCGWKALSRQLDESRLKQLAGLEAEIIGHASKPLLQLDKDFLKAAKLKIGDSVELKPLYTPGAKQSLAWVLRKVE